MCVNSHEEPRGPSDRVFHKIPLRKLPRDQKPLALIVTVIVLVQQGLCEFTAVPLGQKHSDILEQHPHLFFQKALSPNSTEMV